jgi:hypothetical protein
VSTGQTLGEQGASGCQACVDRAGGLAGDGERALGRRAGWLAAASEHRAGRLAGDDGRAAGGQASQVAVGEHWVGERQLG